MAIDTIAGLKAKMPIGQPRSTSVQDLHDLLDTVEDRTTQQVLVKTASYTATLADNRRTIVFNAATSVTLTIPNSMPTGYQLVVAQVGAGLVTISVSGGSLLSRDSHTRIAGQYGVAYLFVYANTGTAPQVILSGDTAV